MKSHTTGEHLDMGGSHPSRAKQPVKLALLGNRDEYRCIREGFLEKKDWWSEGAKAWGASTVRQVWGDGWRVVLHGPTSSAPEQKSEWRYQTGPRKAPLIY